MNKRLVDLHNQTMNWVADNGSLRISDRIPTGYAEKFAELIVEECVSQCWSVSELEHKGRVLSECSKRMRKHFGVEE